MRELRWLFLTTLTVVSLSFSSTAVQAATTTWGDFVSSTPVVGVPTTVSLGGGSTVDVTLSTGGTQGISASGQGSLGSTETGLGYTDLNILAIFNGGGTSTVPTVIQFSNFQPSANHVRGFLAVGAVHANSSPITVTSSVAGAVQTWTQTGSAFDFGPSNAFPIAWNAASGTFTTAATIGNDSKVIVIDVGSLSQYGTITLSLNQHLSDGVIFAFGEQVAAAVPATSPLAQLFGVLLLVLMGTAWLAYGRSRPTCE